MAVERRTRAFWKRLVAEVERGGTIAGAAQAHGVNAKTLAWWRWTLRREAEPLTKARLLPVVFSGPAAATTLDRDAIAIELCDGVSFRVPLGSDVLYVASLVAAVRSAC